MLRGVITAMATPTSASLKKWRRNAVRQIEASRKSTLALVARIPEPEILRPRTLDKWSVKDVLAHLMSCDEETVRRFRLIERGRANRIRWFDMAYANRFNARTVGAARRLSLNAVYRRMARVRAELIRHLERLPVDALADPSHDYTVQSWLPVPGWSHERDHMSEVRAWWRSRSGRRSRSAL
jgi:uncharacterized damage-inducible protein DinB